MIAILTFMIHGRVKKGWYQRRCYPFEEACPVMKKDREKTNTATKKVSISFRDSLVCLGSIGNAGIVTSVPCGGRFNAIFTAICLGLAETEPAELRSAAFL